MPDTNDLSAALDDIRKRWEVFGDASDVPRLLAAVDAVLAEHEPEQLYQIVHHAPGTYQFSCGHLPADENLPHGEDRDGFTFCRDHPQMLVCKACTDKADADLYAKWPCLTYQAISRALTGGSDE